jgi:nucleoside 2-deoxyribosyltransferase
MKPGNNVSSGSGLAVPVPTMPHINDRTSSKAALAEKAAEPVYPDEKAGFKAKDEPAKTEEIAK